MRIIQTVRRFGLVAGNGENGIIESCGPATDVMIFQNMKFNYPTNALRMTPDLSMTRKKARQSLISWEGEYLSAKGAADRAMMDAAGAGPRSR